MVDLKNQTYFKEELNSGNVKKEVQKNVFVQKWLQWPKKTGLRFTVQVNKNANKPH